MIFALIPLQEFEREAGYMNREEISNFELEKLIVKTFKEYGGWWRIEGMAEWLHVPVKRIKSSWDNLESVMERKNDTKEG